MLRRISVGLALFSFAFAAGKAQALPSEADTVKSLQASALQSCARSDIESGLKTFRSAIVLAEKAFGKDSTYVSDLYFEAGVAALKSSNYTQAENLLNKAVSVNPNARQARLTLAEYYRQHGKLASAKKQIEQVLEHDPENIEAQGILAATYQKEGNIAKALEHYGKLELISTMQAPAPLPAALFAPKAGAAAPAGAALSFSRLPAPPPPAKAAATEKSPAAPTLKATHNREPSAGEYTTGGKKHKQQSVTRKNRRGGEQQDDLLPENQFSISRVGARLHSHAKLLTRVKGTGKSHAPAASILPGAQSGNQPSRSRTSQHTRRAEAQKHHRQLPTPRGMVPPPPAVPATSPVYVPPPKQSAPAQAASGATTLKAAVPRVDTSAEEKPVAAASSSSSASSSSADDGEFLLEWADKKKKKK